MNKKMRELLTKIEAKTLEAKEARDKGETGKAVTILDDIDALKREYDVEKRLMDEEKPEQTEVEKATKAESVKSFATAARSGFKSMNEGSGPAGGYTVPDDIETTINHYRENNDSLQALITVTSVNTDSGARTFRARSAQTGFSDVAEGGTIGAKDTPTFTRLEYTVAKKAGYYPVTNELLEDSDQNIVNELTQWIGNESRVTRNKLIMAAINTISSTALDAGADGLKKALNVLLKPYFRNAAVIVTNQDGLNYLDTLKDDGGSYLLKPEIADATQYRFGGFQVKVFDNDTLPSNVAVSGKRGIPFIIGDLKEAIVMFERKGINIKSSDVAGNAFLTDTTYFRAIEREVVKVRDSAAVINGVMTINDSTVTGS